MRLSLSILGVTGVILTVVSLLLPWVVREYSDPTAEFETTLTHFEVYFASDPVELTQAAFAAALYMVIVGLAISIYSLLGGFVTLAGTITFAMAGFFGDDKVYSFADENFVGLSVVLGIGLLIGFVAAAVMIVAIKFPVEVGFGREGSRPRFRTWHLSLK